MKRQEGGAARGNPRLGAALRDRGPRPTSMTTRNETMQRIGAGLRREIAATPVVGLLRGPPLDKGGAAQQSCRLPLGALRLAARHLDPRRLHAAVAGGRV